ncbi:MAG: hypothetical protein ACLTKE_08880 [Coprococcus sp.]
MKPNDFDTNISYKHSKTFSTRMRILLFLALFVKPDLFPVGICPQIIEALYSDGNLVGCSRHLPFLFRVFQVIISS